MSSGGRIQPHTSHKPNFRSEISSTWCARKIISHSPNSIKFPQLHNHSRQKCLWCICWHLYEVQLRWLVLWVFKTPRWLTQTDVLISKGPWGMHCEELKNGTRKASWVSRSDIVGAQLPRSYWTVAKKARLLSLMAWATETETGEEPGCETLLVPSQAPWKPEWCQLGLLTLYLLCLVLPVPLPFVSCLHSLLPHLLTM